MEQVDFINKIIRNNFYEKMSLEKILSSVKITDYALEKARAYARAVCDISKMQLECGGILVGEIDRFDGIATEAYLSPGQEVSSTTYDGNLERLSEESEFLQKSGKKIIGCWHSHNSMNAFHSSRDDENLKNLFLEISAYNQLEIGRQRVFLAGQELKAETIENESGNETIIRLTSDDNPKKVFEIKLEGQNPFSDMKVRSICEQRFIGTDFAYSVVVNNHGKVYSEVYYTEPRKKETVKVKDAPLEIIQGLEFDKSELYETAKKEASLLVKFRGVEIGKLNSDNDKTNMKDRQLFLPEPLDIQTLPQKDKQLEGIILIPDNIESQPSGNELSKRILEDYVSKQKYSTTDIDRSLIWREGISPIKADRVRKKINDGKARMIYYSEKRLKKADIPEIRRILPGLEEFYSGIIADSKNFPDDIKSNALSGMAVLSGIKSSAYLLRDRELSEIERKIEGIDRSIASRYDKKDAQDSILIQALSYIMQAFSDNESLMYKKEIYEMQRREIAEFYNLSGKVSGKG
ncbi:MAG: Mov34/MPN/PAD-1 family protein [Candidatus Woesearchaeota archaeon]|nr:Mov34/MPN/PAD-1 family protein [Candidatus Woesearchaeota archaeon]